MLYEKEKMKGKRTFVWVYFFYLCAVCWSPKGKQIVIGTNDGQLLQFTHNMEQKKIVPKPDFTNEAVKGIIMIHVIGGLQ